MALRTPAELIAALRAEVTEDGHILLDQLEAELLISFWPEPVCNVTREVFGDSVLNRDSRTYRLLDRRIRHAYRVWDERHGPLTQEQRDYADRVLVAAIKRGQADAGSDRNKLYAFVQKKIGDAVNHEVVHEGFAKRGDFVSVSYAI